MAEVAIVTGASGGIGRATARRLAADGFLVAAWDLGETGLDQRVTRSLRVDVRDRAQVRAALETVERELGPVTALVNVAGIMRSGPVLQLDEADWREVIDVNLLGAVNTATLVAAGMAQRGRGVVVNIGSNASRVARPGLAAYAASKAALRSFGATLGVELGRRGVRCVTLEPGSTSTPMLTRIWPEGVAEKRSIEGSPGDYRVGIPLERVATPQDIAGVVSFLVSPAARHLTMTSVVVDGGATLGA